MVAGIALDLELVQGAEHPPPGLVAVLAPDDQLGQQRVVGLGDGEVGPDAGVDPHAGAGIGLASEIGPGAGMNPAPGSSAR